MRRQDRGGGRHGRRRRWERHDDPIDDHLDAHVDHDDTHVDHNDGPDLSAGVVAGLLLWRWRLLQLRREGVWRVGDG
ncbi:MAG: hypothetical protein JRI68_18675 [Deltaproteobacteria bacterium]|nr:hypothetical protein [Deltaproteobacteria bacterium]